MFTVRQTQEFQDWLDALKDLRAQVRIAARLRLVEAGNRGDWKPVGDDVSEMRIDFRPWVSPVFHAAREHPHCHTRRR